MRHYAWGDCASASANSSRAHSSADAIACHVGRGHVGHARAIPLLRYGAHGSSRIPMHACARHAHACGGDRGDLGCAWGGAIVAILVVSGGLSRGLADGVLLALELVRGELLRLLRLQLGRHRLGRRLLRRARRGGRLGGGGARLVD